MAQPHRAKADKPERTIKPQTDTAEHIDSTEYLPPTSPRRFLQLQRKLGNQAAQRLTQQRKPAVIQRNVGFEFEVGTWEVQQLNAPMTPDQYTGTTPLTAADLGDGSLRKAAVLAKGQGFEMQIDEGANDFHLEFVTSGLGFPETKEGRKDLKAAMESMEGLGHELINKRAATTTKEQLPGAQIPLIQTGEVTGGVPTRPETVIKSWGNTMSAEPQTTVGIRLDQIPALMAAMAAQQGETQQQRQDQALVRQVMGGKTNVADKNVLSDAAPQARQAIDTFKTQMGNANVVLPGRFGSESLVGMMALIYTYLKKANTRINDYPKSIFPLLGITNFAAMFNMLPADDKQPFTAVPQRFVDINLLAAGMAGSGGTAFFAGGFANQLTNMTVVETQQAVAILGAITRQQWLSDIPQGTDQLTKAVSHVDALESMGKLSRGEQVGKEHTFRKDTTTDAPILELRRLGGAVGLNNWKDLALDVFDFIVKLNDKQGTQYEIDRYDPSHQK